MNFPFICSNIPVAPAYVVYISQLIRYSRACGSNHDSLDIKLLLTREVQNESFLLVKLKSSLQKFYVDTMTGWPLWNIRVTNDHGYATIVVHTSMSFHHAWLITGFKTKLTQRMSLVEQELLTSVGHLKSPTVVSDVSVSWSLVLFIMFSRSLFVLLFLWPLCCLSFFNIQILIIPLVSSNSCHS